MIARYAMTLIFLLATETELGMVRTLLRPYLPTLKSIEVVNWPQSTQLTGLEYSLRSRITFMLIFLFSALHNSPPTMKFALLCQLVRR